MRPLDQLQEWPVGSAAAVVVTATGVVDQQGPTDRPFDLASVTKVLTAMACWVALEEGTLDLEDAGGPSGSTVRHLLSHASGLAFDDDSVAAAPGTRRIYSNRGIEVAADHLARRASMPFDRYLTGAVIGPLGLRSAQLDGSPAWSATASVDDLALVAHELLAPTLVAATTVRSATAVAFPGLDGVLPGFGRQHPNDWGLGVEVRGQKSPHWTSPRNSPATFGHFGRAGGFVWVDPTAGVACACLTDEPFGPWAVEAWPRLATAVLDSHSG
jgi:CubicO group peptidase (beta-lactamase class C family)